MTDNNIGLLHIQCNECINTYMHVYVGENDYWFIVLVLPLEIIGLAVLIVIFLYIHACHLAIKKKFRRLKGKVTTMEQNEAYGLTTRTQQTRENVGPQTVQEQLTESIYAEINECEYDYIDAQNPSPKNSTNKDFCIEQNQSYAIITSHQ